MNKKSQTRIGRRIRMRREQIGMSQAELARLLSIAPGDVEDCEAGRMRIGARLLIELSRHLNVPIKFIFSDGKDRASDDETGFSEPAATFDSNPEEIVRLLSAFDAIPAQDMRLTVIELAENLARDSCN